MDSAKERLKECVNNYTKIFAEEFKAFKSQPQATSYSAEMDTVEYKVAEYPENLYMLIVKSLSDEEMKWFGTKKGIQWFVKSFPVFGVKYLSR